MYSSTNTLGIKVSTRCFIFWTTLLWNNRIFTQGFDSKWHAFERKRLCDDSFLNDSSWKYFQDNCFRGLPFTWWGRYGLCLGNEPTELAHSFFFLSCSCVYFCPYGPFNCISFHKFSRQLSVFSLSSAGFISALLVLSTICLFMKAPFSPDIIPSGLLGSKHQLIN